MIETNINRDVLEENCASELLAFAKACLYDCFGRRKANPVLSSHDFFGRPPLERVNVTIRTHGRLRGSMSTEGDSLGAQIQGAVKSASRDKRFQSRLSSIELDNADIEVWLQIGSERVSTDEIEGGHFLELGVDGVEIHLQGKSAYYKPSVAITRGKHTIEALMSALCRKADIAQDAWKNPGAVVYRTKWLSLSSVSAGIAFTHAPSRSNMEKPDIRRWLRDSVFYLINSQQSSGDFTYIYDPIKDIEVIKPPNRVRSAGCLYSLSCFYDSPYSDPAETAFVDTLYALADAQVRRTIEWGGYGRVMPEPKASLLPKMGSTALLALALGGDRLSRQFGAAYESLFQSVLLAQTPSGRFLTHFGSDVENERSSEFFSGQALLTLVQRAERGDAAAVKPCAAAFAAYRHQFLAHPTSAFVGWHVDVWSRMALLTQRSEYADFAFEQTDWLLKMQINNAPEASWIGGFRTSDRMPKYSSIVFLEAVVKAYTLARAVAEPEKIERYRRTIQLGIRFCDMLRLSDEQMAWYPNPQRCRGGVALSLLDKRVRCDVPQHFITLCLSLLNAGDLFS